MPLITGSPTLTGNNTTPTPLRYFFDDTNRSFSFVGNGVAVLTINKNNKNELIPASTEVSWLEYVAVKGREERKTVVLTDRQFQFKTTRRGEYTFTWRFPRPYMPIQTITVFAT